MIPFMGFVSFCIRTNYYPRTLSASQISWKSQKEAEPKPQDLRALEAILNSTLARNATDDPATIAAIAAAKAAVEAARLAKLNKSSDIIHEYLAFAILLPNHPFSSDLYYALATIAPLFPSVTVVVGNGYEFSEMCAQYNVRSFPKLLFFKKGILVGRYKKLFEPGKLGAQFAKWTNSLPIALPISRRSLSVPIKTKNSELSLKNFWATLEPWTPPPNEPIVGSVERLVSWDPIIFLLSGLYTILRIAWHLFSKSDE